MSGDRSASGSSARAVVAGPLQRTLDRLDRDRADAARAVGLDPGSALLLPLVISLARLAAQEDARRSPR